MNVHHACMAPRPPALKTCADITGTDITGTDTTGTDEESKLMSCRVARQQSEGQPTGPQRCHQRCTWGCRPAGARGLPGTPGNASSSGAQHTPHRQPRPTLHTGCAKCRQSWCVSSASWAGKHVLQATAMLRCHISLAQGESSPVRHPPRCMLMQSRLDCVHPVSAGAYCLGVLKTRAAGTALHM